MHTTCILRGSDQKNINTIKTDPVKPICAKSYKMYRNMMAHKKNIHSCKKKNPQKPKKNYNKK